jgi:poly-beta-1,6-N-acetyl-D-glucosamine synthase
MRYLVPLFLVLTLATAAALTPSARLYAALLAGQLLFYAAALAGWLLMRAGVRARPLALPAYFVLANLACVLAFYKFLRGERLARWETARVEAGPYAQE